MTLIAEEKRRKDLWAVLAFACFVSILYVIFKQKFFAIAALTVLALSLFYDAFASAISVTWSKFALIISRVNTTILLSLIFFLILTPLAFLYRIFNRNPLRLKRDAGSKSYFFDRDHVFKKEDFEKIW